MVEGLVRQGVVKNSMSRTTRSVAYRLVGVQAVIVLIIAMLWLIGGVTEAWSALLGGTACVLPSLYFARRFFASADSMAARRILTAFYLGELVKLALSAGLVAVIILFVPVSIAPFMVGFVGAQFGFWLGPAIVKLDLGRSG